MDFSKLILIVSIALFGARITQADVDAADSAGATSAAYVGLFGNGEPRTLPSAIPPDKGESITIRPAIYLSPLADGVDESLNVVQVAGETCGPGGCGPSTGATAGGPQHIGHARPRLLRWRFPILRAWMAMRRCRCGC